jgi:hypothetical protein
VIGLSDKVGRSQNALRQRITRSFCDRNHIQGPAGSLFRTARYLRSPRPDSPAGFLRAGYPQGSRAPLKTQDVAVMGAAGMRGSMSPGRFAKGSRPFPPQRSQSSSSIGAPTGNRTPVSAVKAQDGVSALVRPHP